MEERWTEGERVKMARRGSDREGEVERTIEKERESGRWREGEEET